MTEAATISQAAGPSVALAAAAPPVVPVSVVPAYEFKTKVAAATAPMPRIPRLPLRSNPHSNRASAAAGGGAVLVKQPVAAGELPSHTSHNRHDNHPKENGDAHTVVPSEATPSPRTKLVNESFLQRKAAHMVWEHPIYWKATDRALNADSEGKLGPLKYHASEAYFQFCVKNQGRGSFVGPTIPRELRLGYRLVPRKGTEDKHTVSQSTAQQTTIPAAAAPGGATTRPSTARSASSNRSTMSSKNMTVVSVDGAPHWHNGMATGTTIVGVYNRWRQVGPGVGKYNIVRATDFLQPHVQRCSFGTSGRFPGEKSIVVAAPPSASLDGKKRPETARVGGRRTVSGDEKGPDASSSSPS